MCGDTDDTDEVWFSSTTVSFVLRPCGTTAVSAQAFQLWKAGNISQEPMPAGESTKQLGPRRGPSPTAREVGGPAPTLTGQITAGPDVPACAGNEDLLFSKQRVTWGSLRRIQAQGNKPQREAEHSGHHDEKPCARSQREGGWGGVVGRQSEHPAGPERAEGPP